jgi:hypothetical protein
MVPMLDANPFQLLTLIAAPAILTNSSSILSLGTSNRFARTVDRSRFLYEKIKEPDKLSEHELRAYQMQLPMMSRRSLLLVRALTCFYLSVGSFAATAFASIIGAGTMFFNYPLVSQITTIVALTVGSIGVIGLVSGTGILVFEMWLALRYLAVEARLGEGIQIINPIL